MRQVMVRWIFTQNMMKLNFRPLRLHFQHKIFLLTLSSVNGDNDAATHTRTHAHTHTRTTSRRGWRIMLTMTVIIKLMKMIRILMSLQRRLKKSKCN